MAEPTPAPKRKPRRPHPSGQSKLATRVYDRAHPQITGNKTGRPPVNDERLKRAFLGCLRWGMSLRTAKDVVGISDTILTRWRAEPAPPGGIPFEMLMAQTRSIPCLNVSRAIVQKAEKGDMAAARFFAERRIPEYQEGGEIEPEDVGRQIREFVGKAMLSQVGSEAAGATLRAQDAAWASDEAGDE